MKDVMEVAHERVYEMMSGHFSTYIDPKIDAQIRQRYPIRLPEDALRAETSRWKAA
ncbi:MAG: hypothetical protein VYA71_00555 [Pseudomonadota bacterium]|nr:hypothetical protein [Pseudomonadota bacterium]